MRERITISLSPEMRSIAERVRRTEQRTVSELVREALRLYCRMSRLPAYVPTARELRAIEAGRSAFRRGDYMTLDQYLDELGDSS